MAKNLLDTRPDPLGADLATMVAWISQASFPFDEDEADLLRRIEMKVEYTQPVDVYDQYALRILFWQVVGFLRQEKD